MYAKARIGSSNLICPKYSGQFIRQHAAGKTCDDIEEFWQLVGINVVLIMVTGHWNTRTVFEILGFYKIHFLCSWTWIRTFNLPAISNSYRELHCTGYIVQWFILYVLYVYMYVISSYFLRVYIYSMSILSYLYVYVFLEAWPWS